MSGSLGSSSSLIPCLSPLGDFILGSSQFESDSSITECYFDQSLIDLISSDPLTLLIQLIDSFLCDIGSCVSNESETRWPLAVLEGQGDIEAIGLVRAPP